MTDGGLQPVGVQLVAEGADLFERSIGRAAQSVTSLGKVVTAVAAAPLKLFDQVIIGAARRVGELFVNALVRAGREILQFGQRLVSAAIEGTHLESTLDKLWRSAVQVTRTSLNPFFEQFDSLIERAAPKVLGFAQALGTEFGGIAANALTWGENIVSQLAQGMWNAVVYVVQVLTDIGNMITSWLSPGSPPKLLPDLDDWGTAAMNVWLQGWTKGDFGIFKTVASQIESLIRSTAAPGGKDTGIIPRIIGAREGIAQAVNELRTVGVVSEATLQSIIAAVGTADAGVRAYLETFIALEAANQRVSEAQDRLNKVTAEYDALLQPVEDKLAAIDEATLQLAENQQKRMLSLILQDPNATAAEKERARLELERIDAERERRALLAAKGEAVDVAQSELDAAMAAAQLAQEQFESQAALLDLQTEQNNLLREQYTLWERIAAAVEKVAAAAKSASGGKGPGSLFGIDLEYGAGLLQKIKDLLAPLVEAWSKAWEALKEKMKPVWAFITDEVVPLLQKLWTIVSTKGGEAIATLKKWWDETFIPMLKLAWTWIEIHILPVLTKMWAWLSVALPIAVAILASYFTDTLLPAFLSILTYGILINGLAFAKMWEWMETNLPKAGQSFADAMNNVVIPAARELFSAILIGVGMVKKAIQDTLDILNALISGINHLTGLPIPTITPPYNPSNSLPGGNGTITPPATTPSNSMPGGPTITNNGPTYNYAPAYNGAPSQPSQDFALMQVWAR